MEYLPGGEIERTSKIVFFILPWRHDFLLAALGHPRGTDLGQQMNIEFISKDHHLMRLQLLSMPPNPGQALDPLGVVVFGHQLGPFPHPAHVMEPASYGPCGNLQAVFRHELALCVDGESELPSAIEAHNTVDTGARAEQKGRDVSRIAASGAEQ